MINLGTPYLARSAVFAVMDGWVEAGLATWNERCANTIKLRGVRGEVWLLDDSGVTALIGTALDIRLGKPYLDSKARAGVRAASRCIILALDKEFGKIRP